MSAFISAFLDTWGIWATIFGLPLLAVWLERTARRYKNARRAKVSKARDLANARTIAHIGLCGSSNGDLTCDRALRHAGMHADRHTSHTGNPIAWENYGDDFGGSAA